MEPIENMMQEEPSRKPRAGWILPMAIAGLGVGALAAFLVIRKLKKNPEILRAAEAMVIQGINDILKPILENKDRILAAFNAGASEMTETRNALLKEILDKE